MVIRTIPVQWEDINSEGRLYNNDTAAEIDIPFAKSFIMWIFMAGCRGGEIGPGLPRQDSVIHQIHTQYNATVKTAGSRTVNKWKAPADHRLLLNSGAIY